MNLLLNRSIENYFSIDEYKSENTYPDKGGLFFMSDNVPQIYLWKYWAWNTWLRIVNNIFFLPEWRSWMGEKNFLPPSIYSYTIINLAHLYRDY